MRVGLIVLAAAAAALPVACGGQESPDTEAAVAGACEPIEELRIEPYADHSERDFRAVDYPTNPPAGGPHNPDALVPGRYDEPAPLGEAVHLLEHGAVIGWTNELSGEAQAAVEEAFDEAEAAGYFQTAVVENPEMEVPFALSAWGAVQTCEQPDPAAVATFIERWYASPKSGEAALACQGPAATLPPCLAPAPPGAPI